MVGLHPKFGWIHKNDTRSISTCNTNSCRVSTNIADEMLETDPLIRYLSLTQAKEIHFGLMIFLWGEKNLENSAHFSQNFWFDRVNFSSLHECVPLLAQCNLDGHHGNCLTPSIPRFPVLATTFTAVYRYEKTIILPFGAETDPTNEGSLQIGPSVFQLLMV